MRTIVVDDEPWMLRRFAMECENIPDLQLLGSFRSPLKALEFARENRVELAFLDMEMPELNGLQLAGKLREILPGIIIIFVSAYEGYMAEAFRTKTADYYIMKPYTADDIEGAVDRARLLSGRLRKQISVRTFGAFALFVNEVPVEFPDEQTKELLALLVERHGAAIPQSEACVTLLGSDTEENAIELRRILRRLQDTLKAAKLDGVIEQNEQGLFLHTDIMDCDLFQYLDGDLQTMRWFSGAYMEGYSWAAPMRESLVRQKELLCRYNDALTRNTLCACIRNLSDPQLTLTYVNDGFLAITGYARAELFEKFHGSLRALILRDDFNRAMREGKEQMDAKGSAEVEYRIVRKNGDEIWVLGKSTTPTPYGVDGLVEMECMLMDISGVKADQQRVEQAAQRDGLTGLLNRACAQGKIQTYLDETNDDPSGALILMDIDNFKAVNDTYGHPFADTVLTDVAAILKRSFRSSDVVGRLGGDEMMIFLKGTAEEAAKAKLNEAMAALRKRLQSKTERGELSCSFGGVLCPEDGKDFETLYQRADLALYVAKQEKNREVWFSDVRMQVVDKLIDREVTQIDSESGPEALMPPLDALKQRLMDAEDLPGEILSSLAEIGRHFDISRVYIFEMADDGKQCVNTFEWCAKGVEPQIEYLSELPAESLAPYYETLFDSGGLFYCYDVRTLAAPVYEILEPQGIQSMLQCSMVHDGNLLGMSGFDECRERRYWSGRQIKLLSDVTAAVSEALYAYRQVHGRELAQLQKEAVGACDKE